MMGSAERVPLIEHNAYEKIKIFRVVSSLDANVSKYRPKSFFYDFMFLTKFVKKKKKILFLVMVNEEKGLFMSPSSH